MAATKKRYTRRWNGWYDCLCDLETGIKDLCNPSGRSRGVEENKLLLLAVVASLRRRVIAEKDSKRGFISWTAIEEEVASDFHVAPVYLKELRKAYIEDGDVLVWGQLVPRGGAAEAYDGSNQTQMTPELCVGVASYIDGLHATGASVTNMKVQAHLLSNEVSVSRRTVQRLFRRLGVNWRQAKPKKKTFDAYRRKAICNFLVGLDKHVKDIDNGGDGVLVFTDESYIHQGHASAYSYFGDDNTINRKSGKGRRLIILHAITKNGPLMEFDDDNVPIDDLKWKGDTPHPMSRPDRKTTCETLWVAQSHTGDYHDNMNSDMFMLWVQQKLVPVFERRNPGKRMILVADNAPYHHKRQIGSLATITKKDMVALMKEHNVKYIDLPWNDSRAGFIESMAEDDRLEYDGGEVMRVDFDGDEQIGRAAQSLPRVGTLEELKIAFVNYARENLPALLECKVEAYLQERRHDILWTPPYCPDLQPIELFWAAGKNHAALHFSQGRTMKDTVKHLREGWYGTRDVLPTEISLFKKPCDCDKLYRHALKMAETKFVPICDGISGAIGSLVVDPDHQDGDVNFPIDALVIDMSKQGESIDDIECHGDDT